jgi:uncharacterized membrane protein YoaK (UPF0700 family)
MQSLDRSRRTLAFALAGLAGFVDASGYLSADRYFVSFMSGNTTRLGVELARDPRAALVPILLIASFVIGVIGGAMLTYRRVGRHKPALLAAVALVLALAAAADRMQEPMTALALLAAAMGALNNSFQRGGQVSVGLTYMTGALVRMGQGIAARLNGEADQPWGDWLRLWLALTVGAVLGAAAYAWLHAAVFWIASALALVLAISARRIELSPN